VSRVSGVNLLDFAPGTILQRLQRWRVVGNEWEIWSARDLSPIPTVTCAICPVVIY